MLRACCVSGKPLDMEFFSMMRVSLVDSSSRSLRKAYRFSRVMVESRESGRSGDLAETVVNHEGSWGATGVRHYSGERLGNNMALGRQPQVLQLVFVGDPGVGKTSLIRSFLGESFSDQYQPSALPEWRQKTVTVGGVTTNLQIRDVPGSEDWQKGVGAVSNAGVAVIYSCTSHESFSNAAAYLHRHPSQKAILVATKSDELYKSVSPSQASDFARSMNIPFVEVSAKTALNVESCFSTLTDELRRQPPGTYTPVEWSLEDVRQALGLSLEIDTAQARSYSTYSPPLVLSPDSPDSLIDDDQPEEIALVEESGEGKSTLGLVRMDVQTREMETQTEELKEPGKKRGRASQYPTKKKHEELDKYWLRQFRRYLKKAYVDLKASMPAPEKLFWKRYLSPDLKPDKDRQFKSYNKDYKAYLFKNSYFAQRFRTWFSDKGESVLEKKFATGTDGFRTYYDYAVSELLTMGADPDEMIWST